MPSSSAWHARGAKPAPRGAGDDHPRVRAPMAVRRDSCGRAPGASKRRHHSRRPRARARSGPARGGAPPTQARHGPGEAAARRAPPPDASGEREAVPPAGRGPGHRVDTGVTASPAPAAARPARARSPEPHRARRPTDRAVLGALLQDPWAVVGPTPGSASSSSAVARLEPAPSEARRCPRPPPGVPPRSRPPGAGTTTCAPSATGAARLMSSRSRPFAVAPPARPTASAIRLPSASR